MYNSARQREKNKPDGDLMRTRHAPHRHRKHTHTHRQVVVQDARCAGTHRLECCQTGAAKCEINMCSVFKCGGAALSLGNLKSKRVKCSKSPSRTRSDPIRDLRDMSLKLIKKSVSAPRVSWPCECVCVCFALHTRYR